MDTKSLSYDELANLLGIERESARHLAFRRRWRRTKGNDGKARVDVPLDALPQQNSPTGASLVTITDTVTGSEAILTRHIERLEEALEAAQDRLAEVEVSRDEARDEAHEASRARDALSAQVEALNTILAIERERVVEEKAKVVDEKRQNDELRAERDRWAAQAERLAIAPLPPTPVTVERRGLLGLFRRRVRSG